MGSARVVELDEPTDPLARIADLLVRVQVHLLVLVRAPQPFDEHVIAPGPRPSMLMATSRLLSASVKARLVNCLPWSVLKNMSRSILAPVKGCSRCNLSMRRISR